MNRLWRYGLLGALGLAGLMLFLLAVSASNTALFAQQYNTLLYMNIGLTGLVFIAVLFLIVRLVQRRQQGQFGARLTSRFALAFAMMGIVPGILIFMLSATFLYRSIDSWFNVRVDAALESGLALTRTTLDSLLADTAARARAAAADLASSPELMMPGQIAKLRESSGLADLTVFTANGKVLAASGSNALSLKPDLPGGTTLRGIRVGSPLSTLEGESSEGRLRMRVVVQMTDGQSLLLNPEPRYLQVLQPIPTALAQNAEAVRAGYQDYSELSLSRAGLRKMYGLTLTLALLLTVFASMTVAFFLASSMTEPLLTLAQGTRAVAGGDFTPLAVARGDDELALLMDSFNRMTGQLAEARASTENSRVQLEANNAFLEHVLSNLSAGVLVLNGQRQLTICNQSAERILGQFLSEHLGEPLERALPAPLAEMIEQQDAHDQDHWQQQIELPREDAMPGSNAAPDGADVVTLLVRSAPLALPGLQGAQGRVVVFDDITDLIVAQRSTAWAEVARRLAHEIKNPLTPIQLSAERMQHKLADKLAGSDAEILVRGCTTIVNQVTALKRLVNEFRDYARLPAAQLAPLDLNALIEDVMRLYETDCAPGGRIALDLAADLPRVDGDPSQLRQVIHNLVKNALDASEAAPQRPCIWLSTALMAEAEATTQGSPASRPRRKRVKFLLSDAGHGFAARTLARAFEPYVTTKTGGTGLGLAIVKRIIDEHGARIALRNRPEGGAQVEINFMRLDEAAAANQVSAILNTNDKAVDG